MKKSLFIITSVFSVFGMQGMQKPTLERKGSAEAILAEYSSPTDISSVGASPVSPRLSISTATTAPSDLTTVRKAQPKLTERRDDGLSTIMDRMSKRDAPKPGFAKQITQYYKATLGDIARDLQDGKIHFNESPGSQLDALQKLLAFFNRSFDVICSEKHGIEHAKIVLSYLNKAKVVISADIARAIQTFFEKYKAQKIQQALGEYESLRVECEDIKGVLEYLRPADRSASPLSGYADLVAFLQVLQRDAISQPKQ